MDRIHTIILILIVILITIISIKLLQPQYRLTGGNEGEEENIVDLEWPNPSFVLSDETIKKCRATAVSDFELYGTSIEDRIIRHELAFTPSNYKFKVKRLSKKIKSYNDPAVAARELKLPCSMVANEMGKPTAACDDIYSKGRQIKIKEQAEEYEKKIYDYLVSKKVKNIKTEHDLRELKYRVTPDILVNVKINGERIYWIDAKDYPLTDLDIVIKKLQHQADKYNKEFGKGAFVFSGPLQKSAISKLKNILVLDGGFISI